VDEDRKLGHDMGDRSTGQSISKAKLRAQDRPVHVDRCFGTGKQTGRRVQMLRASFTALQCTLIQASRSRPIRLESDSIASCLYYDTNFLTDSACRSPNAASNEGIVQQTATDHNPPDIICRY
jgi:hypothetical protein